MKHSSELVVKADTAAVIEVLADLATYPSWNDLVSGAEPIEGDAGDPGPAWRTTLRAQLGPFARSKQLRFVREFEDLTSDAPSVRFVRRELDGRDHARWVMEAHVAPIGGSSQVTPSSQVTLALSYDGGLWVPALGSVLSGAIERATNRLPEYLETR